MDKKFMNQMDDMEMDKVSGGIMPYPRPRPRPRKHDANSMAANVDETQMKLPIGKLPIGGGHKITMAANVFETQNASACVGK
jgi:hypothetical protein